MTFRAQATLDLPTFVNVDEFGQIVLIDDDPVACVLVEDEDKHDMIDGISVIESIMYVKQSDFFTPPVVRQRLSLRVDDEDRQATVVRVDNEQGMWVIRLQWFNS